MGSLPRSLPIYSAQDKSEFTALRTPSVAVTVQVVWILIKLFFLSGTELRFDGN